MSTQKQVSLTQPYPISIGAMLWIHFVLLLEVYPRTGALVITINEINERSSVPVKLIEKALKKLVRYGYVTMKSLDNQLLRIKLKHYVTVNTIKLSKGQKYLEEERAFTASTP